MRPTCVSDRKLTCFIPNFSDFAENYVKLHYFVTIKKSLNFTRWGGGEVDILCRIVDHSSPRPCAKIDGATFNAIVKIHLP